MFDQQPKNFIMREIIIVFIVIIVIKDSIACEYKLSLILSLVCYLLKFTSIY